MRGYYSMKHKKENPLFSSYINFLYQEAIRTSTSTHNLYQEVLQFSHSSEGQAAFIKFQKIKPQKLGIHTTTVHSTLKRAFQL